MYVGYIGLRELALGRSDDELALQASEAAMAPLAPHNKEARPSLWAKVEDRDAWSVRTVNKDKARMAALDPGRYDHKSTLYTSAQSGGYPGYSPHRRYDRLNESTNGPAWKLHPTPRGDVPPPGTYDLKSDFGVTPSLPARSPRLGMGRKSPQRDAGHRSPPRAVREHGREVA